MTPTHTRKPGGQRYRYYVSLPRRSGGSADNIEIPRFSAGVIESLVLDALRRHRDAPTLASDRRIVVGGTDVRIELTPGDATDAVRNDPAVITVPVLMCRRGNERTIRATGDAGSARPVEPGRALVRAMIRSYQWRAKLHSGEFKSMEALARAEKASPTDMSKLLQLAFLAPDLTEAILDSNQPNELTLANVRAQVIPLDWVAQRELFGRT